MIKHHNIEEFIQTQFKKYLDLVWYARSHSSSDIEYWSKVPEPIREGAFRGQMRVEEDYPDEVTALREDDTNWQHGFNSGMLAAINLIGTAERSYEVTEDGETFWMGGPEQALEEFPMLDT